MSPSLTPSPRGRRSLALAVAAIALSISTPGPAAAAEPDGQLRFHGYGEVHYNNPRTGTMNQSAAAEADYHRFVLGWVYEFTDGIRLDAEVDYEHAAGELELEYAHIDYDLSPTLSLRAGSLLMPVGPLNEFHEPPLFYSVERPYVQNAIIPTTWQENGVGLVGRAADGAIGFRGYLVAGLDGSKFSASSGLRSGRSKGIQSKAEDLAAVARVEYATAAGASFGLSGYFGGADQMTADSIDVKVAMGVADARFKRYGFDLRALFARVAIDGVEDAALIAGSEVGEAMQGWYAEAAYDLLRRDRNPESRRSLYMFARAERFDTQEETPAAYAADPANDRRVLTGGLAFLPIEKISFKADFEHWTDGADGTLNRFNLGAAFLF